MSAIQAHVDMAQRFHATHGTPMVRRWVSEETLSALADEAHTILQHHGMGADAAKKHAETKRRLLNRTEVMNIFGVECRLIEILPPNGSKR